MKYPIFKTRESVSDELLLSTVKEILAHIYNMQQHVKRIEVLLVEDIKIVWSKSNDTY